MYKKGDKEGMGLFQLEKFLEICAKSKVLSWFLVYKKTVINQINIKIEEQWPFEFLSKPESLTKVGTIILGVSSSFWPKDWRIH